MELKIYSRTNALKLTVSPSDNSTRQKGVMTDNVLNLSFISFDFVRLEVNDWVEFDGERYWAVEEYTPKQASTVEWEYDCKFYGLENRISQALVLKTVDGENDPVFTLTAPAHEQVALVVENINRQMGTTDWKVGEVVATENLVIDYEGTYCDEALSAIAEAADAEWWIDGMTVNLCRCEHGESIPLGYDNGATSIEATTADNVKFFTRLFPIGSSRNIDRETYGHTRLQLPGGQKYVQQNTELGIIEHYEQEAFAGIYPRRIGKVTAVRSEEKTGEDGNPFTIYYFKDTTLGFDPNDYEIGGLVKQVTFQSGELNGREFEVNFNSKTREFEMITQWPYDDDTQLPGGLLVPKTGDDYILWNIRMPNEYYALAEQEFAEAVKAYMHKHDKDCRVYKVPTDYVDIGRRGLRFDIGQRIRLESELYFPTCGYRNSRIVSFTQSLAIPTQYDLEIGDVRPTGTLSKIEGDIAEVRNYTRTATNNLPDLIRSWENTPPSDFNLFSAKRTIKEFLSKRYPDIAEGLIRFLSGVEMGRFIPGIETGTGAAVDAQGNAEVTSLTSRSWIKSPYLIYNKVQVTGGEMWNTEGGTIASVEPDGDSGTAFVLTMEIEDGDAIDLQVDDICKGHYNSSGGFVTSYFRVTNIDQPAKRVRIVTGADSKVPGGKNHLPLPFMNIARYGNFTDKKRQRSQYFSSSEGRIALLDGVDQYIIEPRHYKLIIGEVPNALLPDGYPLAGDASIYLDNVLARNFFQIDKDGKAVRTIRDRGLWSAATAVDDPYQCNELTQDDVYHISCKWRCLVEGSTAEPRYDSPDWLLLAGDTTLALDIESSEGDTFLYGQLSTTLKARVRRGVNDITADILPGDWTWTRDTGDAPGDTVWNTSHAGCTCELSLTNEDLAAQSGRFICEAYVRDGVPQTLHAEVAF